MLFSLNCRDCVTTWRYRRNDSGIRMCFQHKRDGPKRKNVSDLFVKKFYRQSIYISVSELFNMIYIIHPECLYNMLIRHKHTDRQTKPITYVSPSVVRLKKKSEIHQKILDLVASSLLAVPLLSVSVPSLGSSFRKT